MNGKTSELRPRQPRPAEVEAPVVLEVCGESSIGVGRNRNEDDCFVADLSRDVCSMEPRIHVWITGPRGSLLGVADGVGGAPGGDVASRLATRLIFKHYRKRLAAEAAIDADSIHRCLDQAMHRSSEALYADNADVPFQQRKGTTATVAAILERRMFVAQVGDSRAYLLRHGELYLITKDQVTESGNFIAQAMGVMSPLEIEVYPIALEEDDRILLCTDGLTKFVRNEEIQRILAETTDLPGAVEALIRAASGNMGSKGDNVTVVVAHVRRERAPTQALGPSSATSEMTTLAPLSPERSRVIDWIAWALAALLGLLLWIQLQRINDQAERIVEARDLVDRALEALRDGDEEIGTSLLEDARQQLRRE